MGRVYSGEKEGFGAVAFKVPLAPEFEPMLQAEADALKRVSHPNVVPYVDWLEFAGGHALVMGFVEGESLEERFTRQPLSAPELDSLARRVADALAAAHRNGVVHRDLKPSNIIMRSDGEPVLLDFGAAMTADSGAGDPMGTLSYMSPEQVLGQPAIAASDQFSFGVVLYEALAGRRPFSGYHAAALEYEICHENPAPLHQINASVPESVSQVVTRLLEKEASARFPSLDAFLVEWEAAQQASAGDVAFRRLVVAPALFVNEMKVPEIDYMGRALGDLVVMTLKSLEGLVLVSRDTVAEQERVTGDRHAAAAMVGAELLVGGRFYKAGEQVRIIAELVKVEGREVVWTGQYRGGVDQFFDLQDQFEAELKAQMRTLLPEQEEVGAAEREPDPEAYRLYREARDLYQKGGRDNIDTAIEMCEQALEIDSSFTVAQAGLADCYVNYYMWFIDRRPIWLDKAERAAKKALEVDPQTAPAYRSLGRVCQQRGDFDKAAEHFHKAIDIDPKYAEAMRSLGWLASEKRDFDTALYWAGEALKAQPADPEASLLRGLTYLDQRNYAHAERAFRELIRLHSNYSRGYVYLGQTLQKAGRLEEAYEVFVRATECDDYDPEADRDLACLVLYLGRLDDARAMFLRAMKEESFEFVAHYYLGLIAHLDGDESAAQAAWEMSRTMCERALSKDPNDQYPRLFLGMAKAALGDRSAYEPILAVRKQDEGSGEFAYFEARAAAMLGDRDRAEACITEALLLPLGPSHAEYSADPHFARLLAASA